MLRRIPRVLQTCANAAEVYWADSSGTPPRLRRPGLPPPSGTADTYTSLLPEADLAIAEAAARLVPRARVTSENAPDAEPEPDDAEDPGTESVPDGADPLGEISGPGGTSAHAPLTQTAPDEESEAE
jgi:hypothetical protein